MKKTKSKLQAGESNFIPNIRKNLFWDIDFNKIDWNKNKRFVIDRILERGTPTEIEEIAKFYDIDKNDLEKYRYNNNYKIHYLEKSKGNNC